MATFSPAQDQRWNLLAPFDAALDGAGGRGVLRAWIALALAALAIAGLAAPLLALSRVPAIADWAMWPTHAFEKGLVLHVVFSFVIWLLAVFAALAHIAARRRMGDGGALSGRTFERLAMWSTAAAFLCLATPALTDADASLNNYVPAILHPLYYGGLALLAVAMIAVAARFALAFATGDGPFEPLGWTSASGSVCVVAALVSFALSWAALDGAPLSEAANEDLFWAGGHALQFLNTVLLIAGWYVLASLALGQPAVRPAVLRAALIVAAAGALPTVFFFAAFEPLTAAHRNAYTLWQYALAPAPVIVGGTVLRALWQARSTPPTHAAARLAVILSIATFAVGAVFGIFVDGADTRTPAHYHGVIGGLNLAAFGLVIFVFLPLANRPARPSRWIPALFWAYAAGQILHSAALFLAGGYGAPRKVAGDVGLEAIGAQVGLWGTGVGGLLAVAGGVTFVIVAIRALVRGGGHESSG